MMIGLSLLTMNPNAAVGAASNLQTDVGTDLLRPDRCCLCGLNSVTKTFRMTTTVENPAGMAAAGVLPGKQTVFLTTGYCTPCLAQAKKVKNLWGISIAGYAKVDEAWRLALAFRNDRVAREYYRLNVDRVLDQKIWATTTVGDVEAVASLLDAGTAVDVRFTTGPTTLLHISAEFGDTEMMDLLIERGADVNAISPKGVAPLHVAALYGGPGVAERLLAAGAHADPVDIRGITPLHIACETGRGDVAKVLLAHGANVNALSANWKTPAMFAASHPEIQELLWRYAQGAAVRPASESGTPAGWHPDPVGRHDYRYWDGATWTHNVADGGQTSVDPVDAPPPA